MSKNAEKNRLKITPFNQYDATQHTVKFILGFGGIPFQILKHIQMH